MKLTKPPCYRAIEVDLQPSALTLAIALAAGAAAQSLAAQVRLPGIVLLLAAGAVLGPEVAGWVDPSALGGGLAHLVEFGVAVVLFQGGLNLDLERLRRQESAIWRLISAGALGTLAGAAVLVWFVLGWEWRTAVLFGSVVVVTGQTVVGPLLRGIGLHPRVRTLLEAEAVLLDPIGALLAAFVLQAVTVPAVGALASEAVAVAGSIAFGLLAGIVVGLALAGAVRFRVAVAAGYDNVVVLTAVILAFELCDLLVAQSGLTAAVVAGVVFGNSSPRVDPDLLGFTNPLTVALVGALVLLLAASVSWNDVRALGTGGFVVVAGLVLIVRPCGVLAATAGLGLAGRERAFLSWVAPRGLVAAVVASLTARTLDAEGGAEGGALQALVFLTVAGTVVLAGLSARPVAWALGLVGSGQEPAAPPPPGPPAVRGEAGPTELGPDEEIPAEAEAVWPELDRSEPGASDANPQAPDAQAPDAQAPEAHAPDAHAPDAHAPDAHAPDHAEPVDDPLGEDSAPGLRQTKSSYVPGSSSE
ncbi:MAG: cation:proton antiporter [Acidobacteria bacterium]|nr:cation:proton antiporter [Acidobacteriota bacterium]